jgi:drug/metabolite transporter (DMT)-like permease
MVVTWLIFAFLAAIFVSAASIVEKKTLLRQHAMEFSTTLSILAAIITLPFLFSPVTSQLSLKIIVLIYLASLTGAIAFLLSAKAMRHAAISITSPFFVFAPLFTAIMAAALLGEMITLMQGAGILILIIGAYFLESHIHENIIEPFKHFFKIKYIRYIFLALILYALASVLDKKIVGSPVDHGLGVPVLVYLALVQFFQAINFIVMMIIFHDGFKGISNGFRNNWKWVLVVAFLFIGSRLTYQYAIALPGVLVSLVIPIKRLSSLFSTIIGGQLFHEEHVLRKALACMVMIIGAILIVM